MSSSKTKGLIHLLCNVVLSWSSRAAETLKINNSNFAMPQIFLLYLTERCYPHISHYVYCAVRYQWTGASKQIASVIRADVAHEIRVGVGRGWLGRASEWTTRTGRM